ncbi:MAG: 16S rRNA (guanine(527)-N(7))-methyltransferase RsmG [Rhodospirillales bacterium]|nr:16S rRNA (guanine(527)-N(7))-methyltransferase RsmG [Rhodospirillales bacterium]
MTPEDFAREIGVSRETLGRFERYAALLRDWNRAINLVGAGSLDDLWRRHMLDSAQLLAHLPPVRADHDRVLVDLGSGAGFPGLVLALLGAGAVHLVEADQRKAAFLREAARQLDLAVEIHARRIEDMSPLPADVVTARACAPLPKLLGYAAGFPRVHGRRPVCLFLKGKRADEELTAARREWNMAVEHFPSRSDSNGRILRIGLIGRDTTKC